MPHDHRPLVRHEPFLRDFRDRTQQDGENTVLPAHDHRADDEPRRHRDAHDRQPRRRQHPGAHAPPRDDDQPELRVIRQRQTVERARAIRHAHALQEHDEQACLGHQQDREHAGGEETVGIGQSCQADLNENCHQQQLADRHQSVRKAIRHGVPREHDPGDQGAQRGQRQQPEHAEHHRAQHRVGHRVPRGRADHPRR